MNTLKKQEKGNSIFHGLLSSHPETEERIKNAQIHASELKSSGGGDLKILRNEYLNMLQGLVYGRGEKESIIAGNSYKNRAYQFTLTLPAGWNNSIKRGNLVSKDPEGIFTIKLEKVSPRENLTPLQVAGKWEEKNGLKRLEEESSTINNINCYISYYTTKSKRTPLRLKVVFFNMKRTGFALICYGPANDFPFALKEFDKTISSLKTLSEKELEELKIKHLNLYTVKQGDNLKNLAEKELGDKERAKELALLNGLEIDSPLQAGDKLKIPSH